MSINPLIFVLAIPASAAALLALLPGYRVSSQVNVLASFATLLAALSLFIQHPAPDPYFLVDDLNIVFIVLSTFVGFTTSVFSATYIAHELEIGRLTPAYLRFYHARRRGNISFSAALELLSRYSVRSSSIWRPSR